MKLSEFLEYLRAHATTQDLATALTQVAVTRHLVPIPVEVDKPRTRRVAS
jgi:hypothetical protein